MREPKRDSDDYLRQDLVAAAKDGICMQLYVQFQVDPELTPVENTSKIWEETDSPMLAAALHGSSQEQSTLDSQSVFLGGGGGFFGEALGGATT